MMDLRRMKSIGYLGPITFDARVDVLNMSLYGASSVEIEQR